MHDPHTAATAATRGFDDDRITDVSCNLEVLVRVVTQRAVRSRHRWHAGRFH